MIPPAKSQNINWGAREQLSHRNANKHREFGKHHWNLMENQASPTTAQLLFSQCLCLRRIFPQLTQNTFLAEMKRNHPATLAKPPCLIMTHHKKLLPGPQGHWPAGLVPLELKTFLHRKESLEEMIRKNRNNLFSQKKQLCANELLLYN